MNLEKELPISICFDSTAYVNEIRRMKTLISNPNLIIPGHDKNLVTKFPKVSDRISWIEESN